MRAQTLPANAGWRWIVAGFAIYRRSPILLSMLVLAYWFTVLLLNVLPVIGAIAASLLIPGLSVGLMQASRNLERGQPIGIQTLYGGLRENTKTLIALGALYLVFTLAVLGISAIADGGELVSFMLSGKTADRETIEEGNFALPALIVMLLMTPVMMAYWFAPVLAAWHKLTVGRALFFSLVACWINWRPFLSYGLGLLLVAGIIPGVVLGVLLALFPGAQPFITALITMPMLLAVAPAIFASFYVSYRDIFGISEIV
jgi:hypothetical protein